MSEDISKRLDEIEFEITRGSHFEQATLPYSKYAINALDRDMPWMLGQMRRLMAELQQTRDELDELKKANAEEIVQFNAGYDAGYAYSKEPEPHYDPDYDVWLCGYAWGKYCREENTQLAARYPSKKVTP
jgi:hypothetical protein